MSIFTDKCKKYVPKLMQDLSLTKVQACGIFGNLGGETGGFTLLQEAKPTVAGSRGGYGWMQWTGPRRKKYESWCKANNFKPADDDTNYAYLVRECLTDEKKSIEGVRKTTTLEAATETFMLLNLRPGIPHLQSRINWAKKAYDATKGPASTNTALAVATAGGVGVASTPTHYWPWIIGITVVVGAFAYLIVAYREYKKAHSNVG